MIPRPSRPPSATVLVLASFSLTVAALAGPQWLRDHVAVRAPALAVLPTH